MKNVLIITLAVQTLLVITFSYYITQAGSTGVIVSTAVILTNLGFATINVRNWSKL